MICGPKEVQTGAGKKAQTGAEGKARTVTSEETKPGHKKPGPGLGRKSPNRIGGERRKG